MSNLKFLKNNYVTKGQLTGFPLEIIDKMIEEQVRQGNEADVTVFEKDIKATDNRGGFYWGNTLDGYDFWSKVISRERFDVFFEKYPRKDVLMLPRVIEVQNNKGKWLKRVVFAFKNDKAVCWTVAETLEDAEKIDEAIAYEHWREVKDDVQNDEPKYEAFDFSNGVGDYSYIIDKIIINKNNNMMFKVVNLFYDDILKSSHINDYECENLFKNYTFEDGSPVGVRIN